MHVFLLTIPPNVSVIDLEIILEGKKPTSSLSLFSLPCNSVTQFSLVQTSSQPEIKGEKEKRKVLSKLALFLQLCGKRKQTFST